MALDPSLIRDSMMIHRHHKLDREHESAEGEGASPSSFKWYDEFAIGWNDIFDQDPDPVFPQVPEVPITGATTNSARPSSVPRPVEVCRIGEAAERSRIFAKDTVAAPSVTQFDIMAPQPLASKQPPDFFKIKNGKKESPIDRGLKDRLLAHPEKQDRKPASVMDVELKQIRASLVAEHRAKQQEARQNRRLRRRCRVKDLQHLEELEAKYSNAGLPVVPDPADRPHKVPGMRQQLAKDFFVELGRRHLNGLNGVDSPYAQALHSAR